MNVLDPTLKVGSWTKDEDAALLASVQRHGPGNWCLVAQDLAPRTDNQCWRRWKRLVGEHNVEAYRSSTRQRKAIVPPNFQGRAKERPIALIQDITLSQKFHESPTTHSPSLTLTTNNNNKKKDHQENFKVSFMLPAFVKREEGRERERKKERKKEREDFILC
jgi:myb proto-oncogene protein